MTIEKKKVDKVSNEVYCSLVASMGQEQVDLLGIQPKSDGSHLKQIDQAIAVGKVNITKDSSDAEVKEAKSNKFNQLENALQSLADTQVDVNRLVKECDITLAYKGGQGQREFPRFDNKIVVKPQQLEAEKSQDNDS